MFTPAISNELLRRLRELTTIKRKRTRGHRKDILYTSRVSNALQSDGGNIHHFVASPILLFADGYG